MYKKFYLKIFIYTFIFVGEPARALDGKFSFDAKYTICFTPDEDCTKKITDLISSAKREILLQGYSFTSAKIAQSLSEAKKRGIDVKVILDKSQKTQKYSVITYLNSNDIPVWIDYRPAIAHNKIIIVDGEVVQTGSFNYTNAAQKRNAENVIIIRDNAIALIYKRNWELRQRESKNLDQKSRYNEIFSKRSAR